MLLALINLSFTPLPRNERVMLHYAIVFFIIAIVAGVFGFGGIAGESAWIAKIFLAIFLVLAVLSLLFGRGKNASV